MPRTIRNWWIEATINGQKTKLAGGPKGAGGGFRLVIHQRDRGDITKALTVTGEVTKSGQLKLYTELPSGTECEFVTER